MERTKNSQGLERQHPTLSIGNFQCAHLTKRENTTGMQTCRLKDKRASRKTSQEATGVVRAVMNGSLEWIEEKTSLGSFLMTELELGGGFGGRRKGKG